MKNYLILLIGAALAMVNQSCSEAQKTNTQLREEMIPVNQNKLYTRTLGHKTPTLVLITGIGGTTSDFDPLELQLATIGTVINYDREGLGNSPWQNRPKDSETIAHELHALLIAKKINEPVILVAHSLGGIHARKFLALYPNKVRGMILIDPTPENLTETLIGQLPEEFHQPTRDALAQEFNNLLATMPEGGVKEEFKAIESCYAQARALTQTTSVPVHIISSMKITEGTSEASIVTAQQLREELINQLCTGPKKHTLTYTAGHFIQKEEPQRIVEALQWILAQ